MKTSLVVDDSRVIRKVACRILKDLAFETFEAEDGATALMRCRGQMPDMILLDWNTPQSNGVDFLKALRSETRGNHPIVVLCTTENDAVRILRIQYGPGEKSVMHSHPDGVVIYLTDAETKMTFPDGTTVANSGKAGTVQAAPGGPHLPQNTGSKAMELLLVEFKTKPAAP